MNNTEYKKTVTSTNSVDISNLNFDINHLDIYKDKEPSKENYKNSITNSIKTTLNLDMFLTSESSSSKEIQQPEIERLELEEELLENYPFTENNNEVSTIVDDFISSIEEK